MSWDFSKRACPFVRSKVSCLPSLKKTDQAIFGIAQGVKQMFVISSYGIACVWMNLNCNAKTFQHSGFEVVMWTAVCQVLTHTCHFFNLLMMNLAQSPQPVYLFSFSIDYFWKKLYRFSYCKIELFWLSSPHFSFIKLIIH